MSRRLNPRRLAAIPELLDGYLAARKLPGYTCLVSHHGDECGFFCGGMRDVERGKPMCRDTVFRIYSMTKPLTSVAIMQLVERGQLRLDDPINKYLSGWDSVSVFHSGTADQYETAPAARSITVLDLLTHTAGFTYGFQQQHVVDELYRRHQLDTTLNRYNAHELLTELQKLPLQFQPGSGWNYSVATDVLGYLVEVITGQPLDEVFRERITGPIGMEQTRFTVDDNQRERFAACYMASSADPSGSLFTLYDDPGASHWLAQPKFLSGGGGLISTVDDYHRFCRALLGGGALDGAQIVKPETLDLMTRNQLPGNADLGAMDRSEFSESSRDGIGFGLGFSVVMEPEQTGVLCSRGEYAWGGLASTAFWIDPQEEIIVIFMTQLIPSSTWPIRSELRNLVYTALE